MTLFQDSDYSSDLNLSIRSSEKYGNPVSSIRPVDSGKFEIRTKRPLIAPAPGQVAVLYKTLANGHRIVYFSGIIQTLIDVY
jgi:tRNA U34 2-thiouridine synthase MnmA/TrmU